MFTGFAIRAQLCILVHKSLDNNVVWRNHEHNCVKILNHHSNIIAARISVLYLATQRTQEQAAITAGLRRSRDMKGVCVCYSSGTGMGKWKQILPSGFIVRRRTIFSFFSRLFFSFSFFFFLLFFIANVCPTRSEYRKTKVKNNISVGTRCWKTTVLCNTPW